MFLHRALSLRLHRPLTVNRYHASVPPSGIDGMSSASPRSANAVDLSHSTPAGRAPSGVLKRIKGEEGSEEINFLQTKPKTPLESVTFFDGVLESHHVIENKGIYKMKPIRFMIPNELTLIWGRKNGALRTENAQFRAKRHEFLRP